MIGSALTAFALVGSLSLLATPALAIDSCLVGTWEAIGYTQASAFVTGGGTGFRVSFKADGTETVDYSAMQPLRAGNDSITYSGTATARISADKGVAKLESIEKRGVTMTTESPALNARVNQSLTGLGPGGLGTATGETAYTCDKDSLAYKSSASRDGKANTSITLVRVGSGGDRPLSTRERLSTTEKDPCMVSSEDRKRAQDLKERAKRWRDDAAKARQAAASESDPKRKQQWEDSAKASEGSARLNEAEAARILCEPAPPAVASGPTSSGSQVSPPSKPPETPKVVVPASSMGICGPDVTHNVLAVLKTMYEQFKQAAPAKQEQACNALVDLDLGDAAWDIVDLYQGSGVFPKKANDPGVASTFESMTGGKCCQPRWPCGPTVAFFGACHNQQVVNYVMWGLSRSLCSTWVNLQQAGFHWYRNRGKENKPEQDVIAAVGEKYGDLLKRNDSPNVTVGVPLSDDAMTNPENFPELKRLLDTAEKSSTRVYKQCATVCNKSLTPAQRDAIEHKVFTFRWYGLNKPVPPAGAQKPPKPK